eukprot:366289-Chlamydomonas_euryale.AAC.4
MHADRAGVCATLVIRMRPWNRQLGRPGRGSDGAVRHVWWYPTGTDLSYDELVLPVSMHGAIP